MPGWRLQPFQMRCTLPDMVTQTGHNDVCRLLGPGCTHQQYHSRMAAAVGACSQSCGQRKAVQAVHRPAWRGAVHRRTHQPCLLSAMAQVRVWT
jgi:hypothetical protein